MHLYNRVVEGQIKKFDFMLGHLDLVVVTCEEATRSVLG